MDVMPSRGAAQMNMTAERNSSVRRGYKTPSQGLSNIDNEYGNIEPGQEIVNTRTTPKRARWSHERKLFLIGLLKDYDVAGYRTNNAWSKEAWTNIVSRLNAKFGTSYTLCQVKQKEQDLKKDYRSVKELRDESGFGWDSERQKVTAPSHVWASFADRKNNSDALSWQDKSFPYFDDLCPLYDGRYAKGRTCHGMDHPLYDGRYAKGRTRHGMDYYVNKSKNASVSSTQASVADTYQSPSPTLAAPSEGLQFLFDEDIGEGNLDFSQRLSSSGHHVQVPPSSTQPPAEIPEPRRGKKQKSKSGSPDDGFHERYLKLKKEEIDPFAAIEERKLEDPYSINKCITLLKGLNGLQMGDILMASDLFKSKDNREVLLSFASDTLRLAWITREIGRAQAEHHN